MEYIGKPVQLPHSLVALHKQLSDVGCQFDLPEQKLLTLTRHATVALYPHGGDYRPDELYGVNDARDALSFAQHVHETCRDAVAGKDYPTSTTQAGSQCASSPG